MSAIEDLSKFLESEESYKNVKETLLSKYNIPINHFEFDYIKKCNDGRELEKILLILLSKEEGYFPELIRETENRLAIVKPKSKLLRKKTPVLDKSNLEKPELEKICKDLDDFIINISKNDKDLVGGKFNATCEFEIRKCKDFSNNYNLKTDKAKAIASTDYRAWDRYDPDTELLKMELEEENRKKIVKEKNENKKPQKSVTFNKFFTEAEAIFMSDREKEQGNEYFKIGDFEEALLCYTKSIKSKPNVNNINNRAACYLKLKKYEEALTDCDRVLMLDKYNLKAHIRKSEALEKLSRFEEALKTIEFVIQHDPNNTVAQELTNRVRKCLSTELTHRRMDIIEQE